MRTLELVAPIWAYLVGGLVALYLAKRYLKWRSNEQLFAAFVIGLLAVHFGAPYAMGKLHTVGVGPEPTLAPQPGATGTCNLKIEVQNARNGTAVSGTVYLLDSPADVYQLIDDAYDGDLIAPMRSLSSGTAEFKGVYAPGTYYVFYKPSSYDAGYYPPTVAEVKVLSDETDLNGYCKSVVGSVISLYPMTDLKAIFAGNEYTGYVHTSTGTDAQFEFDVGPDTQFYQSPEAWVYVDVGSNMNLDMLKINGQSCTLVEASDLDPTDPLRVNWPSGADYLCGGVTVPELLYTSDPRQTVPVWFQYDASGNGTITFYFVALANSEHGDFTVLTFTFTVNTAGTEGWTSS